MTKAFAVAAEKGASFDDIFTVFDADGTGSVIATGLLSGLQKLGNFDEVTIADAEVIIKQFDKDGDNACPFAVFSGYFMSRVQVVSDKLTMKKAREVQKAKGGREVLHNDVRGRRKRGVAGRHF